MIVDAQGAIVGRLASKVAKELLKGEDVVIINAEKAVISGNPDAIVDRYLAKIHRGDPNKGPFYPKQPDKLLRRVVRGMLPYKTNKGRAAFKKLRVQVGGGDKGEKVAVKTIKSNYVTVGDVARVLGWKNK